jgi:hypothetical protein
VKEKPVTSSEKEVSVEPKKRKIPILLLILFLLFLAFCIFAVIMRMRDPNITLWKLLRIPNFSILPKKSVINTRPPKLLTDQKVTQKIPKTGGQAKVTTDTGYTYMVSIGPGVLSGDSTLTLTPLEEPPFIWPSDPQGNNPPPDPGIDIEVDPPLPPPDPPDDTPIDPDDLTDNPPEPPPIDVEVTFTPSGLDPGTVVSDDQDPNEMARQIMESAGLGNITMNVPISPSVTPKPRASRNRAGSGKTPTFFVFVPRNGTARIVPLGPPMGGGPAPDTEPPDNAEPPEGGNGDVPGEGTITPEDPDKGKADDAANQAGANGHCTDEYIFAYTQAYGQAQDAGDTAGMNRYGGALKDCAKDKLSYLKRLCQVDRRLLRRLDFEQYKQSLHGVPDSSDDLMREAIQLETTCKGYYTISGSASPAGFGGDVVINSTIDTHVCGYFDDVWEGTNTYNLNAEGGGGVHNYEGEHKFRLPARGGTFSVIDTPVSQGLTVIGRGVNFSFPIMGFYGTFDGVYSVDIMLYPMANLKAEIPLDLTDCTDSLQEMPAIPLAPEPPPAEIPLEPLAP